MGDNALRYGYTTDTAPPRLRAAYNALAPKPGTQYGDILPVAREGNALRMAMPNAVREGLLGLLDLLAGTETGEVTGRGAASLTLGGLGAGATMAPRGAVAAGGARFRAYHGTRNKADILAEGFRPSSDGGVYLTDAPLEALKFADMKWTSANPSKVLRAEIAPRSLHEVDAKGGLFEPHMTDAAIAAAREGGHDAVALRNVQNFEGGPTSTTYIALDPSIIEILRKYGLAVPAPVAVPQPQNALRAPLPNSMRRPEEREY